VVMALDPKGFNSRIGFLHFLNINYSLILLILFVLFKYYLRIIGLLNCLIILLTFKNDLDRLDGYGH